MGDSCARGGKPGIKETGTPEDVPRTAAITHAAGTKKAPADVMGALLRLELHGFPHPVAELAATLGGYRAGAFHATFECFDPKPPQTNPRFSFFARIACPHLLLIFKGFHYMSTLSYAEVRVLLSRVALHLKRG